MESESQADDDSQPDEPANSEDEEPTETDESAPPSDETEGSSEEATSNETSPMVDESSEPSTDPGEGPDEPSTEDSGEEPDQTSPANDTETDGEPPQSGEDADTDVPQPEGTVPVVMAVATGWQTLLSCDDGRTWTYGKALPDGECIDDGDCDHDPGKGMGLAYSKGWYVGTFGNDPNQPAQIRRTNDGVTWEQVSDQMSNGITVGAGGRLVVARSPSLYSDDGGATWQEGEYFETIPPIGNQRRIDYVPYDGGRYLTYFESSGVLDVAVSSDGVTFHSTGQYPQNCRVADIEYINGVILIANDAIFDGVGGVICSSDDGGESWTVTELQGEGRPERTTPSALFQTDSEVIAFGTNGEPSFTTTDGKTWAPITVTLNGFRHPMSTNTRTFTGGFVSLMAIDAPRLGRSDDGMEWTAAESDWAGYLNKFAPGYLPASSCP